MVVKRRKLYLGVCCGWVRGLWWPDAICTFTLHQLCFLKLRIDARAGGRQVIIPHHALLWVVQRDAR